LLLKAFETSCRRYCRQTGIQEEWIMSESKIGKRGTKTGRKKEGQTPPVTFYGGLKSKNELYFQLASVFREASRGNEPLSGEWMGRIMASQETNTSGKFF